MDDKLIPVNVVIADRSYRLKIRVEEEEGVRRSMKEVNDKILEFKTAYAGKDIQDYIAMVLIMYATQPTSPSSAGATAATDPEADNRLRNMESLLDEVLR